VFAGPVQDLIDELGRLPGIGPKSAQRIAYYLLRVPREDAQQLATAIVAMRERVRLCRRCFDVTEGDYCARCNDPARDASVICVVEQPRDVVAIERSQAFRGRYHVLHGAISPIDGIGPERLRIAELLARLEPEGVREVIICTNSNLEGEATALYLARLLGPRGVAVSRPASGLPVGADLEYADALTLGRALEGRRQVDG